MPDLTTIPIFHLHPNTGEALLADLTPAQRGKILMSGMTSNGLTTLDGELYTFNVVQMLEPDYIAPCFTELQGMSHRDHFAGLAMQSIIGNTLTDIAAKAYSIDERDRLVDNAIAAVGGISYRVADAMLAERDRPQTVDE